MILFSPIRQTSEVLRLFLGTVSVQNIEAWVYDDNTEPESSAMLRAADVEILDPIPDLPPSTYQRGATHRWEESTVRRVAAIKNYAIDRFLSSDAEALFLVDSDVLVPSGTVDHLAEADLSVIAAVYWTAWYPDMAPLPNLFPVTSGLLSQLRSPGHWPVDGLGACTLIRREVLERVRFTEAPHLSTQGEDRWFCWHCHQAGIPLVACTHIEPFHVYRDTDIEGAKRWLHADRASQLV